MLTIFTALSCVSTSMTMFYVCVILSTFFTLVVAALFKEDCSDVTLVKAIKASYTRVTKRVVGWLSNVYINPCFHSALGCRNCRTLRKIPGPWSFPVVGSSWLYSRFGPYTMQKYHESNDDKMQLYGSIVREEVLFNFSLVHLFEGKVMDTK